MAQAADCKVQEGKVSKNMTFFNRANLLIAKLVSAKNNYGLDCLQIGTDYTEVTDNKLLVRVSVPKQPTDEDACRIRSLSSQISRTRMVDLFKPFQVRASDALDVLRQMTVNRKQVHRLSKYYTEPVIAEASVELVVSSEEVTGIDLTGVDKGESRSDSYSSAISTLGLNGISQASAVACPSNYPNVNSVLKPALARADDIEIYVDARNVERVASMLIQLATGKAKSKRIVNMTLRVPRNRFEPVVVLGKTLEGQDVTMMIGVLSDAKITK